MEDGEIFGGFDLVSGQSVSGVLEVEDQRVNHVKDLLLELGKEESELFVSWSGESLEFSSGVINVTNADLGSGSLVFFGVSISLGVEGNVIGELGKLGFKLGKDELVFLIE